MANTFGASDPTIRSINGHDMAGTTANRPANMTVGEPWYNVTTGNLEIANGVSMNVVGNPPDATGIGTAGLVAGITGSAGADGSGTTAGGAGGAIVDTAGAGGSKTGTGAAAGGAGGSNTQTGGAGGNTASAGANAGGAGGSSALTGGAGGNATAGTGNGGAGGNIALTPGAGGTSAGGTAGVSGSVQILGPTSTPTGAAQVITTGGTVTLPTGGCTKLLNPAAAVTGVIMPAGRMDGDYVELINQSANAITFAVVGTSLVADGVSTPIAANTKLSFRWVASLSKWYH